MKMKYPLLILIALFINALAVSQVYSIIDQKTVVAIWLLDEDKGNIASDSSGNNHEGTINNAKWVQGKFGSALDFTGGQMAVPHAEDLTLEDHTISFWAKVPKRCRESSRLSSKSVFFLMHSVSTRSGVPG